MFNWEGSLPKRARQNAEAGFTLIELIVVVAIIALLSAILSLSVRQIRAIIALRKAATIATSEIRRAQASAVADGENYIVEFVVGGAAINVYKEVATPTPSTTLVRQVTGENWPPSVVIRSSNLPACVTATSPSSTCVTFGFLGAPISGVGNVILETHTGTVQLDIEPATGRVRVQ